MAKGEGGQKDGEYLTDCHQHGQHHRAEAFDGRVDKQLNFF
jgi:hypothetical protein